ncbi:MAG: response regulator, partial [Acidobacteriota bacterium]
LEATRHIRQAEAGRPAGARRLPIIAMTAHAMRGSRERYLEAGMDDYVTKPVELATLAATLDKWLPPLQPATGDRPV